MEKHDATLTPATLPAAGDILTDRQAAEFLAVKSRTLRLWRQTRGLPHIRITSRELRYRRVDLDEWIARRRTVISA